MKPRLPKPRKRTLAEPLYWQPTLLTDWQAERMHAHVERRLAETQGKRARGAGGHR